MIFFYSPQVKDLLDSVEFIFIIFMNPDGYEVCNGTS